MADTYILGLFHEATPTAETIDCLRQLGIPDDRITVMSGVPYRAEMLGRHMHYEQLLLVALVGAVSGLIAALALTVGTPLLYTLIQGGQPIIPGPPTLIILFEFTMLGTMVATFAGLLAEITFPLIGGHVYDPRVTEGHIGVLVRVRTDLAARAEEVLRQNGAHHLQRTDRERMFTRRAAGWRGFFESVNPRTVYLARWILILVFLAVPTAIGILFAFSVLSLPIPTQMADQASVAYDMGPRLAAPAAAVPIQGAALIAGRPGTQPLPSSPASIQRGKVFFGYTCQTCHGATGEGNGTVGMLLNPKPANLTSAPIQQLSNDDLFVVITQGFGAMPSLAENLTIGNRWDVVNYVRTLKK